MQAQASVTAACAAKAGAAKADGAAKAGAAKADGAARAGHSASKRSRPLALCERVTRYALQSSVGMVVGSATPSASQNMYLRLHFQ